MKIVLLNGFGLTSNVGDHALLTSTISMLASQFPSAQMHVVPWQEPTPGMLANFERQIPFRDDVELGRPFLPAYSADVGFPDATLLHKVKVLTWTAHMNIKAELQGRLGFLVPTQSPFRVVKEADLVVVRGCNIVQRGSDLRSIAGLRRLTFPLWVARRAGKPTVLLNISVGPVEHPVARRMVKRAVEGAEFVAAREPATQEYLAGFTDSHPVSSADTAFAFPTPVMSQNQRDPSVVGLNVLSRGEYLAAMQGSNESYYGFLAKLAEQLNDLAKILPAVKILAIPHENDPVQLNSDLHSFEGLLPRLAHPERIELAQNARSAADVIRLYSRCSLAVGMRFHGYVLASLAATPMLGINIKSRKVTGIARSLGVEDWMIDLARPGQLTEMVKAALPVAKDLQRSTADRSYGLRNLVLDTFSSYVHSSGLSALAPLVSR
jgi:polysaccharide pyruvyl transferase WcaK-like protein